MSNRSHFGVERRTNYAILQSRAPELLDIPYTRSSVNDHLTALRQTAAETVARSAA